MPAAEVQTLTGIGSGIGGKVVIQITADPERIYDVQITEQSETIGIGSIAVDKRPAAIVEANSLAVDGIAGATITSNAIKDGIRKALASGGFDFSSFESNATSGGKYIPGTYTASAAGMGIVRVAMSFEESRITSVQIDVSEETKSIGGTIGGQMENAILAAQTSEVDGVSGATLTSVAIRQAAANCILQATG